MTARPPKRRSALTNGTRLFLRPQQDTPESRRFADLLAELEAERGGRAAMTTTQREAARQYAGLSVLADTMRATVARGEAIDPEALGQLGDRMNRLVSRMGPVKGSRRQSWDERNAGAKG